MDFNQRLQQAYAALRAGSAATAERALRALAAELPQNRECQWLLGVALLDLGRVAESVAVLQSLLAREPGFAPARIDLARARRQAGQPHAARDSVREVLLKSPHLHLAWLAYGDILVDLGQYDDAREAFERARLSDPQRAAIEQAGAALGAQDWKRAEQLFRAILQGDPAHTAALCGLAAASLELGQAYDAQRLLRHALRQSAWLPLIHRGLAPALLQLGRLEQAGDSARYLQRIEPGSAQTWVTSAGAAIRSMRQEEALSAYERAAQLRPADSALRMSIGHVQKTLGDRAASEASYKAALAMDPGLGEAWWSLADLKNYSFTDPELAEMQRLLAAGTGSGAAPLHFALGKACEQRRDFRGAFAHYARGNALRHAAEPFDIAGFAGRCGRIRSFFDRAFFAAHAGCGAPGAAPIFIVGLPRSGSTLLEQILASHSRVAGTMELPNVLNIVAQLDDMAPTRDGYPQSLARAAAADFAALGQRYLQETAPLAGGRERFTDKLPNNFSHVGLIHAILPRATIIDARRHPMDACFSTFRQHFAEGQTFSRDLETLGRYYRCYLGLMDHWDAVLPGKVLHVQYEDVVREPQAQIRRLLAHCGLAFEPACLDFHATRRAVRTASAEQVRQPLYSSSVGYWRHFEHELAPLRRALGEDLRRFDGIAAADQRGG